jgi:hypothetical protein
MIENIIEEIKFINEKKNLISEINEFLKLSIEKKSKILIKKELEKKENFFMKDKKYYRDLIYFSKDPNLIENLDLEIVFCKGNTELIDIWKYFKVMSSSAVTGDNSFGCLKFMIKDKSTNKYLGILEIGNDIFTCEPRDIFIGWNSDIKKSKISLDSQNNKTQNRLSYIVNITCCIGLQPMSYNLNIGKLLVMTIFSKEVQEHFYNIRDHYFAGVCTFGLYGKSIQYDRLKEIKYIGETKGNGSCEIPSDLYDKIRNFVKIYFPDDYNLKLKMTSPKMRILQFGLNELNINQSDLLYHGKKRGIYFGYTSNESKDFLNGITNIFNPINNIKTFNEIVFFWKNRWANQRWNYLIENNKIKIKYELKDFTIKEKKNEYSRQYQFNKRNDIIWLKNKKQISKDYYYENKENILNQVKIDLENYKISDKYISIEYLGGFFDADGSVYISNNVLFINFAQCVLNILLLIQKQYGGDISKRLKRNDNERNSYCLRLCGKDCEKIIEDLEKTSILKIDKIKKAKEYIKFINKKTSEEKLEIINFIRSNKKSDNPEYFNRINWKYIAGFFDGDGCLTMNYRKIELNNLYPHFSICQKYTPNFLLELKKYIDYELNDNIRINELNVFTYKYKSIKKIYEHIKNNIVVKKFQFDNLIKIIDEFNKPLKERNNNEIKIWTYNLKFNKHEDIDYELNIKKNNIETSIKNNILNKIDESYNDKIKKNTETKIVQSDKKIGIENPNYALQLSDDHALNISIGTTIAKRANNPNLSNEKIREIYELKDKVKQKDVAEKYSLNREIIRRIWNRIIVPTDDKEFILKKQSIISNKIVKDKTISLQEKTSLGKRSLLIEEYIEILKWKVKKNNGELLNNKKIFTTTLSEYLSKLWNKKVTNDIVKNTWSGRTELFEYEFKGKDITFEKYLEILL